MVHLHPSKDFQCHFLEIAFDSEPAPGSMLAECTALYAHNCVEIAKKWYFVLNSISSFRLYYFLFLFSLVGWRCLLYVIAGRYHTAISACK